MSKSLRRSVSKVFGRKGPALARSGGSGLAPLPEAGDSDHNINDTLAWTLQNDEIHGVQAVMIESLESRIGQLEREKATLETQVSRLATERQAEQGQISSLHGELSQLRRTKAVMEETWTIEKSSLTNEHAKQISELRVSLNEFQVWGVKIVEDSKTAEQKIARLQAENEAIVQAPDRPAAAIQRDNVQLKERISGLEDDLAKERRGRLGKQRECSALQENIAHLEDQRQGLTRTAELLEEENRKLQQAAERKAAETRRLLERLREAFEAERQTSSSVFGVMTPRLVLTLKLSSPKSHTTDSRPAPSSATFLQSCAPAALTNQLLDVPLNDSQARLFAANIDSGEGGNGSHNLLSILVCDLCRKPKFVQKSNAQTRLRINEFAVPSQPTSCCSKSICSECYLESLTMSLATDWWSNLGSQQWLLCPVHTCSQPIQITYRGTLESLLRQMGDKDTENNMAMYDRILVFRSALARLDPRPTDMALRVAAQLHTQLTTLGRMHSLFDPVFTSNQPDETGRIPAFNPGQIRILSVDHDSGSVEVPFFMRFVRRHPVMKECIVCTDEVYDIDYGSVEEWLEFCQGFHGDWMWKILLFPQKLGLECSHPIDFCITCLQRHLTTQLEQYGRSRCSQLACPSEGCSRRLTYDEIRLYAAPDTFSTYDHYLHLNALSELPNFRWCLREGCTSGQIYEFLDEEEADQHIICEECAFEMCYSHSMPWHEGQTCEQFDSVREHGDPEFRQTRDWISQNTKPCPSCGENIQKGEYCFHMTCSQCRFEFCWECLADWNQIARGIGEHNANAHNEGCFFRNNGIAPTQIAGTTVAEAMRRRRR